MKTQKMSLTKFRKEMYKWTAQAKTGDTLKLTHNGEIVLTVTRGDE